MPNITSILVPVALGGIALWLLIAKNSQATLIPTVETLVTTEPTVPKLDQLNRFALDNLDDAEATMVSKVWTRLQPYLSMIRTVSLEHGVPTTLIYATIFKESSVNPNAQRWEPNVEQYAMGFGQVLPTTAEWLGFTGQAEQLLDPATNLNYVAKYLRYQLDRYGNDIPKAIAAYNAGSARYTSSGTFINQAYVDSVSKYFNLFNQTIIKA